MGCIGAALQKNVTIHSVAIDKSIGSPKLALIEFCQGGWSLLTALVRAASVMLPQLAHSQGYRVRVFDNLETGNLQFLDIRTPVVRFVSVGLPTIARARAMLLQE